MKLADLANKLNVVTKASRSYLSQYASIRNFYINAFHKLDASKFQSPSINPTTDKQRNPSQNDAEFSVYQRADFTPRNMEASFNKIFKHLQ